MNNKLYVGNLPFSITDQDLKDIFSQVGAVTSSKVVTDRFSGRSKGFGFVEMESEAFAQEAIARFDNAELEGRALTVNIAKPMVPREPGTGGGGRRGGRRGGGRNNQNRAAGTEASATANDSVSDSSQSVTTEAPTSGSEPKEG